MSSSFRFVILAAWLCCWLAAAAPPAPVGPKTAKRPASAAALSDGQIEQDLRSRLAKSKLAINKFQVKVVGGIATIDGKTNVVQHKGIATRMAKAAGAKAVTNRIEVSEGARQKAAARLNANVRRVAVKHPPQ